MRWTGYRQNGCGTPHPHKSGGSSDPGSPDAAGEPGRASHALPLRTSAWLARNGAPATRPDAIGEGGEK